MWYCIAILVFALSVVIDCVYDVGLMYITVAFGLGVAHMYIICGKKILEAEHASDDRIANLELERDKIKEELRLVRKTNHFLTEEVLR